MELPSLPYRRNPRRPWDPADELLELCAAQRVPRVELTSGTPLWLIARYDDARCVLSDSRFSSNLTAPGTALPKPEEQTLEQKLKSRQPGTFLEYDPPDHTRLRGLIAGEFTTGAMHKLRPRIEAIVDRCLDATEAAGPPVDLVQEFALPMPSQVICELLGVPFEGEFDFVGHTIVMTDTMAPPEKLLTARDEMRNYMRELVVKHRRDPKDNLLGRLVRDHGKGITDEELVGIGNLLLIAGHETTAMMLGIGTLVLLQHPVQMDMMRKDPSLVVPAVEELLRYTSIANHGAIRTATEDVEVGGQLIKKGDAVAVSIPLVNRDQTRYEDPHRFDITREPKGSQLAFGHGIHHCIAAPMARLEMQIAFPALLRRFPALSLDVPLEYIPIRKSNVTHGVFALPVSW
ncbi:cytochrome P450 [Nocardia sp. NPDC051929]|uniref:cytochrome P450 n=1 Tax=Nocardia sp. NPDC051929 TaxID=3364327 RepID=UPI0037CBEA72